MLAILATACTTPEVETASSRAALRVGDSADSGGSPTFEPVAVGFEFFAGIHPDGSISGFRIDGDQYDAIVALWFAGLDFFTDGDESARCSVLGAFRPPLRACDLENDDGADLWSSYEGVFQVEYDGCSGSFDPGVVDAFDGMRLGIGFGPITPFLADAFTDPADLAEVEDQLSAEYVAIVDPSGGFVASDWTLGYHYAWDPTTGEAVLDAAGGLTPTAPASPGAATLDPAIVYSYAIWYQDFPYIDLDRLDELPSGDPCPPPETGDTGATTPDTDAPPTSDPGTDPGTTPGPTAGGGEEGGKDGGCGCDGTGGGGLVGLFVLLGVRRRRS